MKFTLGLVTDNGAIDQKAGSWRGGRNMVISKQFGAAVNEDGFNQVLSLPGINIGNIALDSGLIASFQIDGGDRIYIIDTINKTSTLKVSTNVFGFTANHPITGEYYRNSKGEIVIAWTDNNMPPRVMNLETDYVELDKLTRVYLKYTIPRLEQVTILDTGGSLKTGAYFIATAYESVDKAVTPFSPSLGPYYITDNSRGEIGNNYDGAAAGQITFKSLKVQLSSVDTDYRYLIIALVSKIGGVLTSKIVKKILIASNTIETVINGAEDEGVVSIEELAESPDVYNRVKTMTQLNNQLFMANLNKDDDADYQLAALNIKVNYTYKLMDILATDETNPKLDPTRGMMHNEVVMLNIHFLKNDGTLTKGYHIPGRKVARYNNVDHVEFSGFNENQAVNVASGAHINRAMDISGGTGKIFQFFNTADNPNADTNMQFWENEETYPNNPSYGDLQGQKIRHHKFPSITHMKNKYFSGDSTFGKSKLTRLGIQVSNVVLPANCIGYFISAGKRDFNNSTILAQDQMQYSGRRTIAGSEGKYWTSGGNWTVHEEGDRDIVADNSHIRIHAFDLLLDKPAISPNYVEAEMRITNREITRKYDINSKNGSGWIIMSGGLYVSRNTKGPTFDEIGGIKLSSDNKRQDILVIDSTNGNVLVEPVSSKNKFSKATGFRYLPRNVAGGLGIYFNASTEEAAVLELSNGDLFGFNGLTLKVYDRDDDRRFAQFSRGSGPTGGIGPTGVAEEISYLYNLKQYRDVMYGNMYSVPLYLLHTKYQTGSTANIDGGDVLVSDMSFVTYANMYSTDVTNYSKGIRTTRRFVAELVNFSSYRYITEAHSNFYPRVDAFPWLMYLDKGGVNNAWEYNKDYSSVNDINFLEVNNPIENLELNTGFPYRIVRSKIDQAEEKGVNNWRTFPVRDYHEMPKNRGEITNIQGMGDDLIINQKYSLFRTRNKLKIASSEGEIIAGTGDIFAIDPQEIIPSNEGYAGCQHMFSCLLTKVGYFFIDAEQGKVFLLAGQLEEISLKGNIQFFFDALKGANDNPYTDTGFTVGYDGKFNRILISKTNEFTISYALDIDGGGWAFYHDYYPDFLITTRTGLFSFDSSMLYEHNSTTNKATFYNGIIYPSYIVPSFAYQQNLYFYNIKWKSEIRKLDGSIETDETLTHLFIWNSFQATNEINLNRYLQPSNDYNLRKSSGVWHFNKFRDLVLDNSLPIVNNYSPVLGNISVNKDFRYKRRFIDHYLLVKFKYDNQPIDGQQRNLYLYEVDVDYKPVER